MKKSKKKIIDTALEIEIAEAYKAGALGFMARSFTMATLPHKDIKTNEYERSNGYFTLNIIAPSKIGLPFGSIPRLLLSWITTEACKTKNSEILLGDSLSNFMAQLDMVPTGGRWGSITRLKEQMKRLFTSSISCTYDDGRHWAMENIKIVKSARIWWNPQEPDQATLWQSKLLLDTDFFKEIIERPVPIDIRALKTLKKSPMALDIYVWLTYRMSYLSHDINISWVSLQLQFGADYKETRVFKYYFKQALMKVLAIYPQARVVIDEKEGLILKKSPTHVKRLPVEKPVEKPVE